MSIIAETAKADEIRAACVHHMCNTFESAHFDESLVNADMPPHVRYDSMQCRILEMSNTDHMPGELEIIALSNALNRSIVILKEDFSIVNEYRPTAAHTSSPADPLYVRFIVLGHDVGHYECALASLSRDEAQMTASPQSTSSGVPLTYSSPPDGSPGDVSSGSASKSNTASASSGLSSCFSQLKQDNFLKRINKMTKPTVLTSSPYKKKLVDAKQKRADIDLKKSKVAERKRNAENQRQKKQSLKTCPAKQKKGGQKAKAAKRQTQKPQSKKTSATNANEKQKPSSAMNSQLLENPDWYCFMCTESTIEDMIQCQSGCRRWVHCSCAGCGSADFYYCDMCSAGT